MKYVGIALVGWLAAFTAVSMAWDPLVLMTLVNLGFVSVYPFDVAFGVAVLMLLVANSLHLRPDPVPLNRAVLWVCGAYIMYQLVVVLPVAILLHDLRPIDVVRMQEVRLAVVLIPVTYSIVLKFWKPSVIVTLFDAAAALLALWVLYRYVTVGGEGYWDGTVFRMRAVWGGATLLFGWLLLTSLFYWPVRPLRFALALLAVTGLILANHRSGIMALLVSLVVQLIAMRGLARRVVLLLTLAVVVVAGVLLASPAVRDSVAYSLRTMTNAEADPNASDRVVRAKLGMAYFQEHPLGDFIWNQRYYLVNMTGANSYAPHNFVVQLLVTQGLVATGLFLSVIALALIIAWRNRRDALSAVMLSYLSFYVVFCAFNTNIDVNQNVALFVVAVALVLYRNLVLHEEAGASVRSLEGAHASPLAQVSLKV